MKVKIIILLTFIGQFVFISPDNLVFAGTEKAGPEVKVFRFSTELRESIKNTRDNFVEFEKGIGPLEELASLNKEYSALKCQDSMDQGCRALESKLKEKYQEFLEGVASSVEILEKSTSKSMKKMRDHLSAVGLGMYPADIAREINRKNRHVRAAGPMSSRLNEVLKLLGTPRVSLIELAANTALDLKLSLEQLSAIEMSVTGQLDSISLGVTFTDIHDWMVETTSSVRSVLGINNQALNSPMLTQTTVSDYLN